MQISSSRASAQDNTAETLHVLLSDPSVSHAGRRARIVLLAVCLFLALGPTTAALYLGNGSGLVVLLLVLAGTAGCFLYVLHTVISPACAIATSLERFRRGDAAVQCPEDSASLFGLLGKRVNLFLNQIRLRRAELVSVAPHIDLIAHNLPGGLFCCGEDFRLRFISDGLLQMLGCTREDFPKCYGDSWQNIVYSEDSPAALAQFEEQSQTQAEYRISYRIRRTDDTLCWVMESGRLTVAPDGSPEYVCILINDTEQKRIENRRITIEAQYRRALQSVCEMLIQVDLTNDLVLSEYERWGTGHRFQQGESYTHCCAEFMESCVHPDDRNTFSTAFCRKNMHFESRGEDAPATYLEYRLREPSGRYHWVGGTLVPLEDETTQSITAIAYMVDIDERRRREDAAIDKSRRDGLTGLLNRNAMLEHIATCIEDFGPERRHTLFMIDLDNFKAINDTFGHVFGDAVLREAADGIRSVFRPTDALARIGGDEFLVFLEDVDNPELLARKAGEVVRALHKSYIGEARNYPLSCSIGIAVYPNDGRDVLGLFKSADDAMYASKQSGKDKYSFSCAG